MSNMKYILVTGGVISGVGKGVISSSFGTILKCCGIEVTSIKIDPYINLDAGTFSPYEHGEVYVLDDGGEVDLDLGNYERFLDITLHRDNNITTGKIYQMVIDRERRGDYLGKTVQVVPHVTDAIQEWVEKVAQVPVSGTCKTPEVCIIELGGTIGDIESMAFVEAFRQFQFRVKRENFCVAHVSLIPQPRSTGEHKTKPTQSSVRELRGLGLSPDIIVCRSEKPIDQSVKDKISNFCHVAPDQVICIPDLSSIYKVPIFMETHGIVEYLNDRLKLGINPMPPARKFMKQWIELSDKIENLRNEVNVALIGKYTRLEDSYTSITKALQHAANSLDYKVNIKFIDSSKLEKAMLSEDPAAYHEAWHELCKSDGIIVPGGFGRRGVEGKIEACRWCRENNKPFLGICLGFQTAVVEFARNVLNLENAHTSECDELVEHPVIIDMPEHNPGQLGGTMRLGKRTTLFKESAHLSKLKRLYGRKNSIEERHRHRYEVNPTYIKDLEDAGLKFIGVDKDAERMEIFELEKHPYYVAVQFHPEYLSRPMAPSPAFVGLILASKDKLKSYLARGCKLSPREHSDYDETDCPMEDAEEAKATDERRVRMNCQVNGVGGSDDDVVRDDIRTLFVGLRRKNIGIHDFKSTTARDCPMEDVKTTGQNNVQVHDGGGDCNPQHHGVVNRNLFVSMAGTMDKVQSSDCDKKQISQRKTKTRHGKIFVGGISNDLTDSDILTYFLQFGAILQMEWPFDKTQNHRKDYCFITFESEVVADELLKTPKRTVKDKEVDVRKPTPKLKVVRPTKGSRAGR